MSDLNGNRLLLGCSGLGRGELTVDDARDREELATIDAAGYRIAAGIVDPVEHADAVFVGVAEPGFARVLGVLARTAGRLALTGSER